MRQSRPPHQAPSTRSKDAGGAAVQRPAPHPYEARQEEGADGARREQRAHEALRGVGAALTGSRHPDGGRRRVAKAYAVPVLAATEVHRIAHLDALVAEKAQVAAHGQGDLAQRRATEAAHRLLDQAAVVAQNDLRKIQIATLVDTLWTRPIFAVPLATA